MKKKIFDIGNGVGILLFWILIWILLSLQIGSELLLPSPATVILSLRMLIFESEFWVILFSSMVRVFLGIVIAVLIGVMLGALCSFSKMAYRLFYPLITVVRSTPVASFIILALIWLGSSKLPVFICSLIVIPLIWNAVCDGVRLADADLAEVCSVFGFSFVKKIRYYYYPSTVPLFLSSMKNAIGMAWKASVAAEVLAVTPKSIGKELFDSKMYLDTSVLFAWTIVIIFLSILFEKLAVLVFRYLGRKYHGGNVNA